MNRVIFSLVLCVTGTLSADQSLREFVSSNHKFAASTYKHLARQNVTGNFIISPFSAHVILALAQSGAKSETAEEIRHSLSLPNDEAKIEAAFKHLFPTFGNDPRFSLNSVNKIYVKADYEIREEFKAIASEIYGAALENIDFSPKIYAAQVINKWVEENTDHRIHDLIDPQILNNKTRAILINALLFKGNWSSPFASYLTVKKEFYRSREEVSQVDTMHDFDGRYNYLESSELNATFLEMPFEGEDASMTIVLPNDKEGLEVLEDKIYQVLSTTNLTSELVSVALPRFKIDNKIDFKDILQDMRVRMAFLDGEADFSRIGGNKGELFISDIVQKSCIDVNEDGIEAAAATFVMKIFNRNGDASKEFVADHPFLFYIKVKDLVIFTGRVVNPS